MKKKAVLIVKTSSLGDVIHTLPALSDAIKHDPNIQFDWVIEEAFQEIPRWHPAVQKIIPMALRRWRKKPYHAFFQNQEWQPFLKMLRKTHYDLIIDAQGLLKSAGVARLAHGPIAGLDYQSAREPLVSLFYHRRYQVPKAQHAVERVRQLFAQALGYQDKLKAMNLSFGLEAAFSESVYPEVQGQPYVLFLHGTTWQTKLWPTAHWIALGRWMNHRGYAVYLPWGNAQEKQRANAIADKLSAVQVLPRSSLGVIAEYLCKSSLVVSLDSGLTHLSGALGVPTVALFGSTDIDKTGPKGQAVAGLKSSLSCSPCLKKQCRFIQPQIIDALCMQSLSPTQVWQHCLPYLKSDLSPSHQPKANTAAEIPVYVHE